VYLERVFHVRIGKPHRRWQSIAACKRRSYPKCLDERKVAIEKRVEEEMGNSKMFKDIISVLNLQLLYVFCKNFCHFGHLKLLH